MNLLPKLPDAPWPFKTKMRDQLIPRVLKHLTAKRPVAVDRTEFFAHAEAFAALVQLEFVSIPGVRSCCNRTAHASEKQLTWLSHCTRDIIDV